MENTKLKAEKIFLPASIFPEQEFPLALRSLRPCCDCAQTSLLCDLICFQRAFYTRGREMLVGICVCAYQANVDV